MFENELTLDVEFTFNDNNEVMAELRTETHICQSGWKTSSASAIEDLAIVCFEEMLYQQEQYEREANRVDGLKT